MNHRDVLTSFWTLTTFYLISGLSSRWPSGMQSESAHTAKTAIAPSIGKINQFFFDDSYGVRSVYMLCIFSSSDVSKLVIS